MTISLPWDQADFNNTKPGGVIRVTSPYAIERVNAEDVGTAATITDLHEKCFGDSAPIPEFYGDWWIAKCGDRPVAFAALVKSTFGAHTGYLKRVGVLEEHRGKGLQKALLDVREARARVQGFTVLITDTTDNLPSANNLIRAGFLLFKPEPAWALSNSLYWRKALV